MITQDKVIETLEAAAELLKIGWIRGAWAKDSKNQHCDPWNEDACAWCIEGAILAKTHFDPEDKVLADACIRILQVANPEFTDLATLTKISSGTTNAGSRISKASAVPRVNDRGSMTQNTIGRIMRNGIELAKRASWNQS